MEKREVVFLFLIFGLIFVFFLFAFSGPLSITGDAVDQSDPSLNLWLKFDNDPSSGVIDATGKNPTTSCSGTSCPTFLATGGHDGLGAYQFDGVDDVLNIGDSLFGIPQTNEFTVSLWIYPKRINVSSNLITRSKYIYPFSLHFLESSNDRAKLRTGVRTENTSLMYLYSNAWINTNSWTHIVLSYSSGSRKIYLNGVEDNSNSLSGTLFAYPDSLCIGTNCDLTRPGFEGIMDDIRIYNRQLSSSEVSELYGGGGVSVTSFCGNNIVESNEVCDGASLNGKTCVTQGFLSGVLGCNPDCSGYNITQCIPVCQELWTCTNWSNCINNVRTRKCVDSSSCNSNFSKPIEVTNCNASCVEKWECTWSTCNNGVQGKICTDVNNCGTTYGKPAPENRSCFFLKTNCGDNLIQQEEVCDGSDLGGNNCNDLGFTSGSLKCSLDCLNYDTGLCNSKLGEICDGSCATQEVMQVRFEDNSGSSIEGLASTTQAPAEINKEVKWIQKIKMSDSVNEISLEIPENVDSIKIKKFVNSVTGKNLSEDDIRSLSKKIEAEFSGNSLEEVGLGVKDQISAKDLTPEEKNFIIAFFQSTLSFFKRLGAENVDAYISESTEGVNLVVQEPFDEIEIEYTTEAPKVDEKKISNTIKEIVISSPEDIHYENILTYTKIEETTSNKEDIKLYWVVDGVQQAFKDFTLYDENNNGLFDKIEWITPHLSSQTFIVISGSTYNLRLFDSGESNIISLNSQVNFYADYTNQSQFISGASCTIYFDDGSSAMSQSGNAYTYSRSFTSSGQKSWNVTCSSASYPTLTTSDFVFIGDNSNRAIIIDHNSVDEFNFIPEEYLAKVRNMSVQIIGQSHARQIPHGLYLLGELNPSRYNVQFSTNPLEATGGVRTSPFEASNNSLSVERSDWAGNWQVWGVDDNSYWSASTGRDRVKNTALRAISENRIFNISFHGWCWDICNPVSFYSQGNSFGDIDINTYLNAISEFNSDPSINSTKFVYVTSISDCGGSNPNGTLRMNKYNDVIRNTSIAVGGILFDQADIENYDSATNSVRYSVVDPTYGLIFPRNPDYSNSEDGFASVGTPYSTGHTNDDNTIRKAKAMWVLLAKLSGWGGVSQCNVSSDCADRECNSKTCDVNHQCVYSPVANGQSCNDDGLFCNGEETCQSGSCISSGNPCTQDSFSCTDTCNENVNQCNVANNSACLTEFANCNSAVCNPSSFPLTGCGNYLPTGCDAVQQNPVNLKLWYKFDDPTSDRVIFDSSDSKVNATCSATSCPAYDATGGHDGLGAYQFGNLSGIEARLSLPLHSATNLTSRTITFWAKLNELKNFNTLFEFRDPGYNFVAFTSTGDLRVGTVNGSGTGFPLLVDKVGASVGTWTFYSVVYNLTDQILNVSVYRDATLVSSTIFPSRGLTPFPIRLIGARSYTSGSGFNGSLDDFRVYDGVLSPSQINSVYTGTDNPICGNNILELGEVCDGTVLNGQTCVTQKLHLGNLQCNSGCDGFDTSQCVNLTGVCYTIQSCSGYNQSLCNLDPCNVIGNCSWTGSSCIPVCIDNDGDGYNSTSACGIADCDDTNSSYYPDSNGFCITQGNVSGVNYVDTDYHYVQNNPYYVGGSQVAEFYNISDDCFNVISSKQYLFGSRSFGQNMLNGIRNYINPSNRSKYNFSIQQYDIYIGGQTIPLTAWDNINLIHALINIPAYDRVARMASLVPQYSSIVDVVMLEVWPIDSTVFQYNQTFYNHTQTLDRLQETYPNIKFVYHTRHMNSDILEFVKTNTYNSVYGASDGYGAYAVVANHSDLYRKLMFTTHANVPIYDLYDIASTREKSLDNSVTCMINSTGGYNHPDCVCTFEYDNKTYRRTCPEYDNGVNMHPGSSIAEIRFGKSLFVLWSKLFCNITSPQISCTDNDGDGWNSTSACNANGVADCNDNNINVRPNIDELCDDNLDNNCNGEINETCLASVPTICSDCGAGFFNLCDRAECHSIVEGCYYKGGLGRSCSVCSNLTCIDYENVNDCSSNQCSLVNCTWNNRANQCIDITDDSDADSIENNQDNCPSLSNYDQLDTDNDGIGNVCDNCRYIANPTQDDSDGDKIGDACDKCPGTIANRNVSVGGCVLPVYNNFVNNLTTNFSDVDDLTNVSNFSIGVKNEGAIFFRNKTINLENVDLSSNIIIKPRVIFVNASALPELNDSAILHFYEVNYVTPKVLVDGEECLDCKEISYTGNTYVIEVSHFSEYEVIETYTAPATGGSSGGSSGSSKKIVSKNVSTSMSELTCTPWNCTAFSACKNGVRRRSCVKNTACSVQLDKPIETQDCSCSEDWSCDNWNDKFFECGTRSCIDVNNCGTENDRPLESRVCDPFWQKMIERGYLIMILGVVAVLFVLFIIFLIVRAIKKRSQ